jgi:hypothetical protein
MSARVLAPDLKQTVLMNVIHKARVGRLAELEQLDQKVLERRALVEHHGRIVAREVDRPPLRGAGQQVHDPEVAEAVSCYWVPVRESVRVLEAAISAGEVHELDRSVLESAAVG